MHAIDVLRYGHGTFMAALEYIPEQAWELEGACGTWSVKNIVAHLASYEQMLADLLTHLRNGTPEAFVYPLDTTFNDDQVARRQHLRPAETLVEYQQHHERVMALITSLPTETLHQTGLLTWYGPEYDLEDFLIYTYYGHKREHGAQLAAFQASAERRTIMISD